MDSLNSVEFKSSPLITTSNRKEMIIQLEGTHTSCTDTESPNLKEKKSVQFKNDDETQDQRKSLADIEGGIEENCLREVTVVEEHSLEERDCERQCQTDEELLPSSAKLEKLSSASGTDICQRFNQIMDMFDNFTKNLEILDLAIKPSTTKDLTKKSVKRKRTKSLHSHGDCEFREPLKHRSRYDEFFGANQNQSKTRSVSSSNNSEDLMARQHFEEHPKKQEIELKDLETITKEARSISVATSSCQLKTLGCQTQSCVSNNLNDDLTLMEVSSFTSRSEPANSLNNYAQAENACITHMSSQQEILKKPLKENIILQTSTPVIVQEPRVTPAFNVITIEANSLASSIDLRRAPLCQRMWTVIGDFCAATILCLQVNRDCIFCLGFFAAFVVSASFLTAFFYHTLSVSPTLWQGYGNVRF